MAQLDLAPGASYELTADPVADVIDSHVILELESLDRVYLNIYQPKLQTPRAVFHFLRDSFGQGAVSSHQMKAITDRFLLGINEYAVQNYIPLITFKKIRPKKTSPRSTCAASRPEGVLFIGKAQEKVRTFRTEGRKNSPRRNVPLDR